MDRRSALKSLTMSLGYAVSAPLVMNIFTSCSENSIIWKAKFLSEKEQLLVSFLVDIILPKSDVVGGLDVNIPQFLDLMYHDVETENNQKLFKNGAEVFAKKFEEKYEVSVMKGNRNEFETLLSEYLDVSSEDEKSILEFQNRSLINVSRDKMELYNLYKFLLSVRYYVIFGYCTSKEVGEEVLSYDPIPGEYKGCIPVEEVGNTWSIS